MRIVSLVPSWTEYLVDLDLSDALIGRTKFCVRAGKKSESATVIGGTKNIQIDRIRKLKPDLMIASKEENDKESVEQCSHFAEVLLTDVRTVEDAFNACIEIGKATGKTKKSSILVDQIRSAWGEPKIAKSKGCYVVWKSPLMLAGPDTFIHSVMQWWGIENTASNLQHGRYPSLTPQQWIEMSSGHVLLPSEPFPFGTKHLPQFQEQGKQALLVDGEAFSWYGSRMLHVAAYLEQLQTELLN